MRKPLFSLILSGRPFLSFWLFSLSLSLVEDGMGHPPRTDTIHQHRPHLQQNDATLVITVEAEAENDAANRDLGCGSVEEEVLLAVGDERKGRE